MSGQPLRYTDDAKKFRKAYMATLQLQQDINQKNYEANALYRRTGVVPTQITDYRSTSEKLADVIKLRVMIRSQLRQIADSQNAENIAQSLTADQLVFASQSMDAIIKELKPQYKFGVPKEIFMKYLENYMTKTESQLLARVGLPSVETPARSAPASFVDGVSAYGDDENVYDDTTPTIFQAIKQFVEREKGNLPQEWLANSVIDAIDEIGYLDFDKAFVTRLEQVSSAEVRDEIIQLYMGVRRAIPQPEQVAFEFQKMREINSDTIALQDLLAEFLQVITVDASIFRMKEQAEGLLEDYFTPKNQETGSRKKLPEGFNKEDPRILLQPIPPALFADKSKGERGGRKGVEMKKPDLEKLFNNYKRAGIIRADTLEEPVGAVYSVKELYDILAANIDEMRDAYEAQQPNVKKARPYTPFGAGGVDEYDFPVVRDPKSPPSRRNADDGREGVLSGFGGFGGGDELRRLGAEEGIEGVGVRKRRSRGRGIAKGVDYAKGIEPLPKYAPLGQYYINQQKLKDDIVTCCRADGRNANDWKSKRVSLPLANLIRKLVDKGKPSFDDINALSDEDKHILGEFVRKAKLDLEVPHSTTSREDLNQFEIMKGEIMAGNDSTELIKKFKLLIVKLTHQGRLPKGQGKEILMELASLGY